MFLWLKWLTDGKIKYRRLPTLHCDTMATVQLCPDCAGFANETVPFLALICLTQDKFLENAPSFLGFRRASYRGTVCGHSEIFFQQGAPRASSPWRPHRFNRITSLRRCFTLLALWDCSIGGRGEGGGRRDVRYLKVCKVQQWLSLH